MPKTRLSWQPGYSLDRKPAKRPTARRTKQGQVGTLPRQFEFIAEHPMRSCGQQNGQSVNPRMHSQLSAEPMNGSRTDTDSDSGHPLPLANHRRNDDLCALEYHEASSWAIQLSEATGPFVSTTDDAPGEAPFLHRDGTSEFLDWQAMEASPPTWQPDNISVNANYSRIYDEKLTEISLVPTVLYNSISHRYKPVLERYNQEFCKIPLTSNLIINPFRYRTSIHPEPVYLFHAVMALAGHHIQSPSTQNHRHTALQLLRQNLTIPTISKDIYSMLDAIILLFSLDETQSALGTWSTHLSGAYSLLEACGGIQEWGTSLRAVAQVGILTWWDAIASLVSREDCIFPYSYYEAVSSGSSDRGWDYFGLCGCPPTLVQLVMRLARISSEKRKSCSMRFVTFDAAAVSDIEQSLESWHHISPDSSCQDEASMQLDQDTMHCSEAWRNGLLIYIYRVFHWKPGVKPPMHILRLARATVDHAFVCRDETMISRQALLPFVFAGCELGDRSLRTKIISFCSVWNERTRYGVFGSAIPLLNGIWAEQESRGVENVWWGDVVDRQHEVEFQTPLQMRLCFG